MKQKQPMFCILYHIRTDKINLVRVCFSCVSSTTIQKIIVHTFCVENGILTWEFFSFQCSLSWSTIRCLQDVYCKQRWACKFFVLVRKLQIRKFWSSFRNWKSWNFWDVPVRKVSLVSQVANRKSANLQGKKQCFSDTDPH
jgi:hypothetical protein